MGEGPVFELVDVVVQRDRVRALDGFTAAVPAQGVTAVFGPSGSGKSTMLRLCNRLEVPTSGRVFFWGNDIAECDPLWLRRRVGMCFQRSTPFAGTVADNLRVARPDASEAQMAETLARVALGPGTGGRRDSGAVGHPRCGSGRARRRPHSAYHPGALHRPRFGCGQARRRAGELVNGQIGWIGLATSLALVAFAAAISLWQRLGLERQVVWAAARALVQLLLVGGALTLLFEPGRSLW